MWKAIWTLCQEHQGCPCHAWHSPVHDSWPMRKAACRHPSRGLVCPINPIFCLYHSILLSDLPPLIPLSIHIRVVKDTPLTSRFRSAGVEHCPAHTDAFLNQRLPPLPPSVACAYPAILEAGSCFALYSAQSLVFHNVFRAFLQLGM